MWVTRSWDLVVLPGSTSELLLKLFAQGAHSDLIAAQAGLHANVHLTSGLGLCPREPE